MSQKIIVTFDEQGGSEVKVEGFKGSGCKALTKALESALGKTTEDKVTSEFHSAPVAQQARASQ